MTDLPTTAEIAALPKSEFAFPGPLRDRLVAAILDGRKTATTGLAVEYETHPLPEPGEQEVVIDSDGRPVAVIETTDVRIAPLAEVPLEHAIAEGEGDRTLETWRANHEAFWTSDDMRGELDDPDFTIDDATLVVLMRFRLIADLR
jgi:uncharacterized protein YhfF